MSEGGTVLVVGATGKTGHRVVARLLEAGRTVRVLSRSEERAAQLGPVQVHAGDLRDPGSLSGMAAGVSAVVGCAGSRTYFGSNGGPELDAKGTKNLVEAIGREGRPHLVFLSAFGLDRRSIFLSIFSAMLNRYFRWKAVAEAAVRDSGLPYTIVRPVELRDRPPREGMRLNQAAPLSLLRTVSRDLVAEGLVRSIGNPAALERTFELCEGGDAPFETQLMAMKADHERPLPTRTPLW